MSLSDILKAIEIIVKKKVDIVEAMRRDDCASYNSNSFSTSDWLSEDEFRLVKGVINEYR